MVGMLLQAPGSPQSCHHPNELLSALLSDPVPRLQPQRVMGLGWLLMRRATGQLLLTNKSIIVKAFAQYPSATLHMQSTLHVSTLQARMWLAALAVGNSPRV
jgi:hypothetical protein